MIAWLRQRRRWKAAASWYARMANPCSSAEVAAFEAWLARDQANAVAYAEMEALANAAGRARPASTSASSSSARPRPALALAIVGVALVATAVILQPTASPAFAAISNHDAAVRGVRLTDGTVIWLDAGARIGVWRGTDHREIDVRAGRVRIVPVSGTRPLEVTVRGTTIVAGDGPLDVALLSDGIVVSAVRGELTIVPALPGGEDRKMLLRSGRSAVLDSGGMRPAVLDRTWPAGRLRFKAEPLGRIVDLANRQGDPDLLVDDKDTAALRVSGVFDLRDTGSLARKLAATLDLKVEPTSNGLLLHR